MPLSPTVIISLLEQAFGLYLRLREAAKASGISDEELDAITADYEARIAAREAEAAGGDDQ